MKLLLIILTLSIGLIQVFSQEYEMPPTVKGRYGTMISPAEMEECIKLYNEIKWLNEEIDRTVVDQYSSYSVNAYNNKVNDSNMMSQRYNRDCAKKYTSTHENHLKN